MAGFTDAWDLERGIGPPSYTFDRRCKDTSERMAFGINLWDLSPAAVEGPHDQGGGGGDNSREILGSLSILATLGVFPPEFSALQGRVVSEWAKGSVCHRSP